jgi:hypothetical protein
MPGGRTTRVVCRRCLAVAAAPTLVATAIAAIGVALADAGGAVLAPWLHLPAFVAAGACCTAAVECWPTFAQRRPGADWLLRILPPPLFGCAAAAAGALLALGTLLALPFALAAIAAPVPHTHHALDADGVPLLRAGDGTLTFAAGGRAARELLLRPVALLPAGAPEATGLLAFADDQPLAAEPWTVAGSHELVRMPFAPRTVTQLRLQRAGGNIPLVFPSGSVVLVEAAPRSRLANCALALATYLLPAAVALALAALAAPATALPVNLLLVLAALLLQTLGNIGPTGDAIAALLRGRWLPAEPLLAASVPSLGTGALAMILAMLWRGRLRR